MVLRLAAVLFIIISYSIQAQNEKVIVDPVAPIYLDSIAGSKNIVLSSSDFPNLINGKAIITVILNNNLKPINFAIQKLEITNSLRVKIISYNDGKLSHLLSKKKYLVFNSKYYPSAIRKIYTKLSECVNSLQFYQEVKEKNYKIITFPVSISITE